MNLLGDSINLNAGLIKEVPIVDYEEPLVRYTEKLFNQKALIVTDSKGYYGIVDSRSIIRRGLKLKINEKSRIGKFAINAPLLSEFSTVNNLLNYFYKYKLNAFAYSDNNKILGVVDKYIAMRVMLSLKLLSGLKVKDIMSSPVVAITENETLGFAIKTMNERAIHRLIVYVDNSSRYGLITYTDIIRSFLNITSRAVEIRSSTRNIKNEKVGRFAVTSVYTISSNSDIDTAIREMVEKNISSLVVDDGKGPIGIISFTDLVKAYINSKNEENNNIIVSGLDKLTYDYEDYIKEELGRFKLKIERLEKVKVKEINLHIKANKRKLYEIVLRAKLENGRVESVYKTGYLLENLLNQALDTLKNKILKNEDRLVEIVRSDRSE
ncbi:MAG: hypothetical protein ARM1_0125 [Candidatus Micrarchaeota archaeon]|nr:MAG: hypothetical protein ARM1_0125 [Candidatus Micrarchaeota archaeon]